MRPAAALLIAGQNRYSSRSLLYSASHMKIAPIALLVACVAALLLLLAGPGTRFGWWEFGTGFLMMRWAFFAGLAGAGLAVLMLLIPKTRRGSGLVLSTALVLGAGVAWVPWNGLQTVRSLPLIHDISTDTVDPPQFVAVLPLRAEAPNPPDYAGEEAAAQQLEAYPDIQPLQLDMPPTQLFDHALETAREMGWEIVAAEREDGRIEATATTFWFGFKDDVVIRIVSDDGGSRLDIRSKSRVGRSDVGANAARIRAFSERLGKRLD
jgi:uncharacterized protein (DUF1499 family)